MAYFVAGLKYDLRVWREQWPRIMDNAIDACRRHDCRLVFFDNVYAYGRVDGVMTEETPFNPTSRKGEVRARIATRLLDAIAAGEVNGMIVRSADFYGPGAVLSFVHATVFERLKTGKTPQWLGDPKKVQSMTYTPDAGRAVAVLGRSDAAYGRTASTASGSGRRTGFRRRRTGTASRRRWGRRPGGLPCGDRRVWWRGLATAGAVLTLILMALYVSPTKILPILAALAILAVAIGLWSPMAGSVNGS